MTHPDERALALFAGDDLGWLQSLNIRAHVSRCTACRDEVQALQASRARVAQAASGLPPGLNWGRLAQEMSGNIRVGLAAGECVSGFQAGTKSRALRWKPALAIGAAATVFVAALVLNLPAPQASRLSSVVRTIVRGGPAAVPVTQDGIIWEASSEGIQVREGASSMSLLPQRSDRVTVSLSVQNSAGQRYVDDTGQVTENKVYYEQ
jgi:hypothetical protein